MVNRQIKSLRIRDLTHLAKHLGTTPPELDEICHNIETHPRKYYFHWEKKTKKGKVRPMVKVYGRLRNVLDRLNYLLQRIKLPPYVHGGVPGRSTITNALPHRTQPMVLGVDIEKHFPNVRPIKVYSMFVNQQQCTPNVARVLTRLTTLDGGLPQGSPTSVAVSNLVTLNLSKRLRDFAEVRHCKCTQYVDDYTFSGKAKFASSEIKILNIIAQEGFKVNPAKTKVMKGDEEKVVAGIKVNARHLDVPRSSIKDVRAAILDLKTDIQRGYPLTDKQIRSIEGKIRYISSFNRGAGKFLHRQLRTIAPNLH
ncbi:MAG: reverse transcriptase family protein [Sedimentisphaerales bacterium]|jgi:RNA-directed DNA polymerase